ncbi:type VI secretion system lipoprotein TssJ [Azohydromonas caseinilytica]|uniref:Type VI secretion system lipoprotein TssJ n=1 Tax=Azohydromonas caseinilytica TaxID=2728836 RepID=A0A848FIR0_9BURK|nr:type VI secretion system lipoprotein TssJ [Azohydromonas caseinilytica]NML19036.1 type VI secretion system lipoprotein TssJ [Azohydromonas caseinilytica]
MFTFIENLCWPSWGIPEQMQGSAHLLVAVKPSVLRLASCSAVLSCCLLSACSTASESHHSVLDSTLHSIGLQRLDGNPLPKIISPVNSNMTGNETRRFELRLHAAYLLNVAEGGVSLPVVTKLYKLRNRSAFERMPFSAFQQSDFRNYQNLSNDIIEIREIVLTPGEKYETMESMEPDASYFAVAAIFRSPAERRWLFIFDARTIANTGVTLGLHGCAVSVAAGQPLNVPSELKYIAGVRCNGPFP